MFIVHASSNICEYDYVVTSNSLHLFNAVYQCHALKCALNLLNIPNRQQASKGKQHQVTKFPYPSCPKDHSTSIVEALKNSLATVSYLSGAGVDWLSGKPVVGLNLPEERGRETQNNSRVNEKS